MDRFSAHLDRGWDLAVRGETTQALIAARQALEIDGDSPEVHNLMGYVRTIEGDYDEALECYRRAIDLDEWYLEPILGAAEILAHPEADPEEAIRLCRRASDMELNQEELADALLIEIDALLSLRRDDEARERLERCEGLDSIPAHYLVATGRLLFELGDLEKARATVDRAIALDGELAEAWYTRGVIERESGERVAAVIDFLETLEHDTRTGTAGPGPSGLEAMTRAAIARLPEAARAVLDGTELVFAARPTARQVRDEVDPRQVVLAEGIDPARRAFERLHVFGRNLERVAPPAQREEELAQLIAVEIGFEAEEDEAAGGPQGE
jgi:tetratricopeptide (TPR) repeat protein